MSVHFGSFGSKRNHVLGDVIVSNVSWLIKSKNIHPEVYYYSIYILASLGEKYICEKKRNERLAQSWSGWKCDEDFSLKLTVGSGEYTYVMALFSTRMKERKERKRIETEVCDYIYIYLELTVQGLCHGWPSDSVWYATFFASVFAEPVKSMPATRAGMKSLDRRLCKVEKKISLRDRFACTVCRA